MIPNRLIFIWFGDSFPWENIIAMRSAINTNSPDEVLLIHQGLSADMPELAEFFKLKFFRFVEADVSWFKNLPDEGIAWELFQELTSPASRANLLRLAVLWKMGGVYLDTDTITIRDLTPLRQSHQGFIGVEPVALPREYYQSSNPLRHIMVGLKFIWREFCARTPGGAKWFRYTEGWFHPSVNNAVIGSIPEHPMIKKAFETILTMDAETQRKRFRLGTHLMQDVTGNTSQENFEVFDSEYFYPLGPEISAQWFKKGTDTKVREFCRPNTFVVHWYNSVERRFLKENLSADWVKRNPACAFSKLVSEYGDEVKLD